MPPRPTEPTPLAALTDVVQAAPVRDEVAGLRGDGGPSRFHAFGNPNYRLYFVGQTISQTGSWMQRIAQSWLVLDLTGSPSALGILTACQFGPALLFTLFGGVLADRIPRRPFILSTNAVALVQGLLLTFLALSGTIQVWHVYVLAFTLGTVQAFEMPARQAFVGEIVGREDLQSAVALNSTIFNGARIVGPSIGGLIVATWGPGWCFLINTISYVAVLTSIALLKSDRFFAVRQPPHGAVLTQLVDGVTYTLRRPRLAFPALLIAVLGLFGFNFTVVLPLLARYTYNVGPTGFGNLNTAMGVGSLVGALAVATRLTPSSRTVLLSGAAFSAALFAMPFAPSFVVLLGLLTLIGGTSVVYSTITNTTMQLGAGDEYRGRVVSLYQFLFMGTTPIGGALTGVMASAWGVDWAVTVEASISLAAVAVGAYYLWRTGLLNSR